MRDVHDLGDAPDQVQAMRDDREDAAEQQAEGEVCCEQRGVGHAPPRPPAYAPVYGYWHVPSAMSLGKTTFFTPACHWTRTIEWAIWRPRESTWNCPKKSMMCMLPSSARTSVVFRLFACWIALANSRSAAPASPA